MGVGLGGVDGGEAIASWPSTAIEAKPLIACVQRRLATTHVRRERHGRPAVRPRERREVMGELVRLFVAL
jgi:hypothetical protein